ncbi:MAG: acyltransferase family protein [Muribaculaceae bacterium]|nr:acyltransferase family protein [Muribaculaceae bacterium]
MTKQESVILKGVAILFMIYGHLFLPNWTIPLYNSIYVLDGVPFEQILMRATGPVTFYLLLGGYGMYYIYKKKQEKNQVPRILNLYINYWVVLLLFVAIGHFIKPTIYPGSFETIIKNATGFNTTYNGEWWFLLPYSLVVLSSYWVFKFVDRFNSKIIIGCSIFGMFVTSFIISRFGTEYLFAYKFRYNCFLYFHLLWEFVIGAMLLKMNFFERAKSIIKKYLPRNIYVIVALLLLVVIRCLFDTSAVHIIYVVAFIALFLSISRYRIIDSILSVLGKYSMNMWFIHTWFCYYLFADFIYGFKYPLIIFIVLVVLSLVAAMLVSKIANIITKRI